MDENGRGRAHLPRWGMVFLMAVGAACATDEPAADEGGGEAPAGGAAMSPVAGMAVDFDVGGRMAGGGDAMPGGDDGMAGGDDGMAGGGDAMAGGGDAMTGRGGDMAGAGGAMPGMGGVMPTPGGTMPSAGGAMSGPLPELVTFRENPSDRFLVDPETVNDGHLFRGEGAAKPHRGAHVYFEPSAFERYAQTGRLEDLPAVYAVADGVVARVDLSFAQRTGNTRYGLLLDFATRDGQRVNMNYSIEPFLNPGDADFYRPFLRVAQGQAVREGEVIAYVYSSMEARSADCADAECTPSGGNAHIHFELNVSGHKMSPSIFSAEVMAEVQRAMNVVGARNHDCASGRECEDGAYEACGQAGGLGYALSAAENPFESEAAQCL